MSTGIDFGNHTCTIAVTRKGGIDVIANEASNRLNPSLVGFGLKERYAGEAAQTQYVTNVKSTISQVKRFIGRKFSEVQDEIHRVPFVVKELPNNEIGFEVFYNGETLITTPVRVVAILLNKLKQITEKAIGTTVTDVVISVPPYFTDAQRRALLNSAEIAGLNCLRLMNESIATALYYGFYRLDLSEKEPMNVLFIDCGHSATVCSVVALSKEGTKGKLKVLSTTFDSNLGGRDFDDILANHFIQEFKTKYGINVSGNPRALLRVRVACEKLKQVLSSGVGEAPINIESLMEDKDVSGRMTRKDFEELINPYLQRMVNVAKQALEESGLTAAQLASAEIVGGNKRVPAVQKAFSDFLGRDLMQTLNDVESVSRGCALQCAMLSPIFKVREFSIIDFQPYPIELSWKALGQMNETENENEKESSLKPFPRASQIPGTKLITLKQSGPFEFYAQYENHPLLPSNAPRELAKVTVPSLPPRKDKERLQIRVKVKVNHHGIFNVENIEHIETYEVEVQPPAQTPTESQTQQPQTPQQPPETPPQAENAEASTSANEPTKEASGTSTTAENTASQAPAKKKKTRQTEIAFTAQTSSLSKEQIQAAIEEEHKMQAQDRLAVETAEAKNAVESYVLGMRSKISEELSSYATDAEKAAFLQLADQIENWLYDEGDDVSKGVYLEKLKEIKKLGDPVTERKSEEYRRESNLLELKQTLDRYRNAVKDSKYEHIEQAEKDQILANCNQIESSVSALLQQQNALPKTAPPVLSSAEILNRKKELEKMANTILNKPKPTPPPAPAPAANPTPDAANNTPPTSADVPMQDADDTKNQSSQDVPMPDATSSDQSK